MTKSPDTPPVVEENTEKKPWYKKKWVWAVALLIVIIAALPTSEETDSATEETAAEETTAAQIDPAQASESETEPEPEPIIFSGRGDYATETFELESGLTTIQAEHEGGANFAIKVLDGGGNQRELAVNEIGRYSGTRAFAFSSGTYLLDITASGPWIVEVNQPRPSSAATLPLSEDGRGDSVVGPLRLSEGLARFQLTHQGNANFAAILYRANGRRVDLLVNEIGAYSGSKATRIPDDGIYYLDLTANGSWSVMVSR